MEALAQVLRSDLSDILDMALIGLAFGLALIMVVRAHRSFTHWRRRRKLEREGELLPEEVMALRMDLAEDPDLPEPDLRKELEGLALSTAIFVITAIVFALDLPFLLRVAIIFAPAAIVWAFSAWRKANDPPAEQEARDDGGPFDIAAPFDFNTIMFIAAAAIGGVVLLIQLT